MLGLSVTLFVATLLVGTYAFAMQDPTFSQDLAQVVFYVLSCAFAVILAWDIWRDDRVDEPND